MQRKWLTITNVILLIVLTVVLIYVVWNFSFKEIVVNSEECVDVNKVVSFIYDSCYDAASKNIFLEIRRSFDTYRLRGIDVSFFDVSEQSHLLREFPNNNESKAYKIFAEIKPQNLNVALEIVKDFSAPICEAPRKISIGYCPTGYQEEGVNVSISPFGIDIKDIITIGTSPGQDSDVFSLNLVDKERVWQSKCESRWECSSWDSCEDGVQRRICEDKKECFIPTSSPITVQYCDGTCVESWECEWSKCNAGVTTPKCKDVNSCGTSYDIPQKIQCDAVGSCTPDIQCNGWSDCDVNYDFNNLIGGDISSLHGVKSRTCRDAKSCADTTFETRECSVNVDIYTRRFLKCGIEYVGIYNRLDNYLIARIDQGGKSNPHLNIVLDDSGDSPYCDYCFDGVMSGDEEGVDCGGGCGTCGDKYRITTFKKKSAWFNFTNWLKRMLT